MTKPDPEDFESLADELPHLAWMADATGEIFWYNRRWLEFTGLGVDELRGWGWKQVHHPDHVVGVVERIQKAFRNGVSWEDTFPLRDLHGNYRWFLSRMQPWRNTDGAIVRWFGTNTDITERRTKDAALSTSERRYQSLVDATASIVWRTPASGEFETDQNGWAAFTGQPHDQSRGWGWLDAVHPEDRGRASEAWSRAVDTLSLFDIEYRLRRHDGEWRWMNVRAAPVLGADGELLEWVGTHSDIQDRKHAEAALELARETAEAANRAKSQFIANMSHELRTPLSAVIGYSEMLEEEVQELGQTQLLGDLQKINSNARHLLALISDVLDISKIEANRMTVFAENVDVAELVTGVASTVDSLMRKRDNVLALEIGEGMGTMFQDQTKIRQCLFNLLGNASKFTENGRIVLKAERHASNDPIRADRIVFTVRDSGIGMTEEQLGRLFQRFSQADESTTRRFGGTGLGLAITKSFVEMLDGSIAVSSVPGDGTSFVIDIPALYEAPSGEIIDAEPNVEAVGIVLVVDDDASTRDLISRFLRREGFQVRTAADGRTGLALARTLRPRAILLDIMMPQMDGWEVLNGIKSDPELMDTPVVMISFVNEPGLASALGATDYLNKPVEWDQLKLVMDKFRGEDGSVVLIIDDDPGARQRMHTMLTRRGLAVATAENGLRGLEAVRHQIPSLILLDLAMPEMDGFDFLENLRRNPDWSKIPVIVMTSKQIDTEDRKRLSGKVDRVISKGSVNLRELANQLSAIVQGSADQEAGGPI